MDDVKKYDAAYRKVMDAAFKEERKHRISVRQALRGKRVTIEALVYADLRRRIALLFCSLALILLTAFLVIRSRFR